MSSVSSQLKVDGVVAKIDHVNEALVTEDALHANIHAGEVFENSYVWTAVSTATSVYMMLETGTDVTHMAYKLAATGTVVLELFRGPTTTADGTPLVSINRNQISTNTASPSVWFDPTVTVPGSSLSEELVPGGSGPHSGGGAGLSFHEWVLQPSTRYLLKVSNISGSSQEIGLILEHYTKEA